MPVLTDDMKKLRLPPMVRVRQAFASHALADIAGEVRKALTGTAAVKEGCAGRKVALAVGSRGIHNIAGIVRATGQYLREIGADPFVVPAMGSHGGATAEGQRGVLANYGVTEAGVGMPVVASMEVVPIGVTGGGIPVVIDRAAAAADVIIPIARVKPHTDFTGPIESGLCKMLAIGLGKHAGCSRLHQEGFDRFAELIPAVAQVILANAPVKFGIAILEDAFDKTAAVEVVPGGEFLAREPELLARAKAMMPRIMVPVIDVLIVEQIGKDISGAGMDPNIVGRTTKGPLPGFDGPAIQRIVVLDLSEETHGNATGIGLADFTTRRAAGKIVWEATYANVIASANPEAGRLPVVAADEREAVLAALQCCSRIDIARPRIVKIKNTLQLAEISVSEPVLPSVAADDRLAVIE